MTDFVGDSPSLADVEAVYRGVHGQAVATLSRIFGDITLAEDSVQDAFVVAAERWTVDGIPPNPAGWIITAARNRAIDQVRRARRGAELHEQTALDPMTDLDPFAEWSDEAEMHDDQLRLIFTCCHPALRQDRQVALTLRLLGGLSVGEVAQAFVTSESAMAKRLVRAKHKIKAANIPYRVPSAAELPDRLRPVLAVVYLIYNAGVDQPDGARLRADAIRLGRSLTQLMPDELEVAGLVALMLLSEARATARVNDGEVVPLKDQDRSRWNRSLIDEGHTIVKECVRRNQPGAYQLQAAIQAVHCDAEVYEATDWRQILDLYDHLLRYVPTAVVKLNRAIALAQVDGPEVALSALNELSAGLTDYYLFHATRGTLLRRMGDEEQASAEFRLAANQAPTERHERFLLAQT